MFEQPKEEEREPIKPKICPFLKEVCGVNCALCIEVDDREIACSIYRIARNN